MWVNLMPLNCTLNNGQHGKTYAYFTTIEKGVGGWGVQGDQNRLHRNRNAAVAPRYSRSRVKNPDDLAATEAKCEERRVF